MPTAGFMTHDTRYYFNVRSKADMSLPFFFRTDSTDSPDCLLLLLSLSAFYVLVFLFQHFLVVGSVPQIKLTTQVGFRAHVTIASRIV